MDTRMTAIVASASGAILEDAVRKVLGHLKTFYGDEEPILLCELHADSVQASNGLIQVTATGYHKPGQVLACTRSTSGDTLVRFDAPCIYSPGSGRAIAEPAVPNSFVGMHRGNWVYVKDGDNWVSTKIPERDRIDDSNAHYWTAK